MAEDAQRIEGFIRNAVGNRFRLTTLTPVCGGSIHRCVQAQGEDEAYFVKLGGPDAEPLFTAEADGLSALRQTETFHVPAALGQASDEAGACLILEWLDLQALNDRAAGHAAGEQLAALHAHVGDTHGWHQDNFLGLTPQANTPDTHWTTFVQHQRIAPMVARALERGFDEIARPGNALIERIPALLVNHAPPAALLHGDLWHGNIGVLPDGRVAVFDPAVSRGDPESDLAMAALFGGFPDSFFAAYRSAHPLPAGYELRDTLYRLYHVLNHLVLFGRGYLREALRLMELLLKHR